jgi:Rrf2 family protein
MRISSRSDYAVRALLELALVPEGEAVPLAEIATRTNIPFKYLERIFRALRDEELVIARRGHSGGYALARPSEEISVADVIRLLDDSLAPMPCASELEPVPCPPYLCPSPQTCVLRDLWLDARDALAAVYEETTFADLAERLESRPREQPQVVDVYAQPREARRRHWAKRTPRAGGSG